MLIDASTFDFDTLGPAELDALVAALPADIAAALAGGPLKDARTAASAAR